MWTCFIKMNYCICNFKFWQQFLQLSNQKTIYIIHFVINIIMCPPKLFISTLENDFNSHILFKPCNMFEIIINLSVCSLLFFIVFFYHFIKFLMINILHILKQIICSTQNHNIVFTIIIRFVLS